jgi:beta-N-acetylhexosaminidase
MLHVESSTETTLTETLRAAAGRTILVGLPGPELDDETARRLRRIGVAGVVLFRRNLVSPAQTAALLASTAAVLPHPALLALDQEGGQVSRLEPFVGPTPTGCELGASGAIAAREFGESTGMAMRALGFNLDFAPVVDLCPATQPNGIGSRSYSAEVDLTVRTAGAFLGGLQSTGVAGCLKHFPGLGDTAVDSHRELPTVHRSEQELEACDLVPYRQLAGDAAAVMVGHGHYPAIDGPTPIPATCSPRVVQGWLRERVGFQRLAVSDDMLMGAVAPRDIEGAAAYEALAAGLDLLLYCDDLALAEAACERVIAEASADPHFARRVLEAAERVVSTTDQWPATRGDLTAFDAARARLATSSLG